MPPHHILSVFKTINFIDKTVDSNSDSNTSTDRDSDSDSDSEWGNTVPT